MKGPEMSMPPNWSSPNVIEPWPDVLPSHALWGIRKRRMLAWMIDLFLISLICMVLWFILGLLTFGTIWLVLPPLYPLVTILYNGTHMSGPSMATPGQRAMDLRVQLRNGMRVPFLNAAVHSVLFYVSWMFPLIFIVSLLDPDKRCLHDIIAGLIFTRR
jgi:uncharacterized RDD family membrane protein YckC